MVTTVNLGITLLEQSQAQKEVTINQAFSVLDAVVGKTVVDKDLATPPASPLANRLYIVASSPTGAWAGKATYLAYFDQVWRFVAPPLGMCMWVQDESLDYRFNGTAWVAIAVGGGGGSGNVTGAATTTTNAIGKWGNTTGTSLVNSGIVIDAANNMTGIGSIAAGPATISGALTQTGGASSFTASASSSAATTRHAFIGAADTALTASAEAPNVHFNLGQIRQHATGALTLQRDCRITPSTHSFVAASTLTDAYGTFVDGAPIAGTNATITNSYALGLGGRALGAGVTNSYGLIVNPNTGAVNNYGSWLRGITIIDNFRGTTTNDNAAAGMVGEYISATVLSGAAVAIATATATNVASISLTPGDWDVSGFITAGYTGTAMTRLLGWTSASSATLPVFPNNGGAGGHESINGTSGIGLNTVVGVQRFSLATTTSIYLSTYVTFTNGAAAVFGFIRARRMR